MVNQLFGDAPEDQEVGDVVRAALAEMRAQGTTLVEVNVADLADQLANSNLLAQELKFYLREYFEAQSGSFFSTVEDWLDSGLLLSKTGGGHIVGRKTLTSAEADALKAGSVYVSLLSAETPLRGARADLHYPA
ncbi:MAG: hypothetical protein JO020_14215 [Chloroflexi bacterium]|nr:hypothetical protein [Chloroflexota bacterium]MBV9895321.1 hypothetical protein [Chloroflexota bacterium]